MAPGECDASKGENMFQELLVVSRPAERLEKMKSMNQLLDLASLKLLKCSFKEWCD